MHNKLSTPAVLLNDVHSDGLRHLDKSRETAQLTGAGQAYGVMHSCELKTVLLASYQPAAWSMFRSSGLLSPGNAAFPTVLNNGR